MTTAGGPLPDRRGRSRCGARRSRAARRSSARRARTGRSGINCSRRRESGSRCSTTPSSTRRPGVRSSSSVTTSLRGARFTVMSSLWCCGTRSARSAATADRRSYSNIARLVPQLPPSPPEDLTAEPTREGIRLRWLAAGNTLTRRRALCRRHRLAGADRAAADRGGVSGREGAAGRSVELPAALGALDRRRGPGRRRARARCSRWTTRTSTRRQRRRPRLSARGGAGQPALAGGAGCQRLSGSSAGWVTATGWCWPSGSTDASSTMSRRRSEPSPTWCGRLTKPATDPSRRAAPRCEAALRDRSPAQGRGRRQRLSARRRQLGGAAGRTAGAGGAAV